MFLDTSPWKLGSKIKLAEVYYRIANEWAFLPFSDVPGTQHTERNGFVA